MMLSTHIERMQKFMLEYGDMRVIYSKDDIGEHNSELFTSPCLAYVKHWEDVELQTIFSDDPDLDDEDYPHKAVCIN